MEPASSPETIAPPRLKLLTVKRPESLNAIDDQSAGADELCLEEQLAHDKGATNEQKENKYLDGAS